MSGDAWFEDDEFWLNYAPLMFNSQRWAEVSAVVDAIVGFTGCRPGAEVLDSCCGPGRHGLELARRGYRVCGVDRTAAYLDAFAASATAEGLRPELVLADVRDFERPAAFDLALNLFTSFGYFESRDADAAYLGRLFRCIRPGGHLVIELLSKELAARRFSDGEWFERDGMLVCTEYSITGDWEGLRNRWLIVDGQRRVDHSWVQRLYSAVELKDLLTHQGFTDLRCYGDADGRPYDQNAQTLLITARKPLDK